MNTISDKSPQKIKHIGKYELHQTIESGSCSKIKLGRVVGSREKAAIKFTYLEKVQTFDDDLSVN